MSGAVLAFLTSFDEVIVSLFVSGGQNSTLTRMELGNFGDHKTLRDGVSELRIDTGPGYRIYYAITDRTIVLLLCGGNKRSQDADIKRACALWQDWQASSPDGEDEP